MSKLEFSEDEKERIKNDIEKILNYMGSLKKVNTDGVEEFENVSDKIDILREDIVLKEIDMECCTENFPENENNYFKVPNTLK